MTPRERLCAILSELPGVTSGLSKFGTKKHRAWTIAKREFAHLHADDRLDLRLPRALQRELRGDPRAHFRKSPSVWIELEFHDDDDVARVVEFARKAWAAIALKP